MSDEDYIYLDSTGRLVRLIEGYWWRLDDRGTASVHDTRFLSEDSVLLYADTDTFNYGAVADENVLNALPLGTRAYDYMGCFERTKTDQNSWEGPSGTEDSTSADLAPAEIRYVPKD